MHDVFLLSPASCTGRRAAMLLREDSQMSFARQLREGDLTLGAAFTFLSGLYFRGKLAYARRFASSADDQLVITTNRGLLPADTFVTLKELQRMGCVPIDAADHRYRRPFKRAITELHAQLDDRTDIILLGSIASGKYVDILTQILGDRLLFPLEFVGRGDMSRGGLMLRCVDESRELTYAPVITATRRGQRPPKLDRRPGIMSTPRA